MKKINMVVVDMKENEVSACPYCGGVPALEVEIEHRDFESDSIKSKTVTCPWCGISAPLAVWEAIADKIQAPVCEDAGECREEYEHDYASNSVVTNKA